MPSDVHSRLCSSSDASREIERTIERMGCGSGHTHVIENYSGGWSERTGSLRLRERIRQQLDQ